MNLEYDADANALYIRLEENGIVDRQIETEDGTIIDVDNQGRPLGIEIISPEFGWSTEAITSKVALSADQKGFLLELKKNIKAFSQFIGRGVSSYSTRENITEGKITTLT